MLLSAWVRNYLTVTHSVKFIEIQCYSHSQCDHYLCWSCLYLFNVHITNQWTGIQPKFPINFSIKPTLTSWYRTINIKKCTVEQKLILSKSNIKYIKNKKAQFSHALIIIFPWLPLPTLSSLCLVLSSLMSASRGMTPDLSLIASAYVLPSLCFKLVLRMSETGERVKGSGIRD